MNGYAPEKSADLIDFIHFYVLLGTNGHQKEAIFALLAADCNPGKLNGYAPEYVRLVANASKIELKGDSMRQKLKK